MLAGMGGSLTPPSFLLFLTIQLTSWWNFAQKSSAKHSHKIYSKPPKLNRWNLNFKWWFQWFPNFGICSSGSVLGFHVTVASGGCSNEIISQPMEKSFNIQSCKKKSVPRQCKPKNQNPATIVNLLHQTKNREATLTLTKNKIHRFTRSQFLHSMTAPGVFLQIFLILPVEPQ